MLVDISVELNVDCDIVSREFPGVEVQPVVRNLDLVTIHNLLLEYTILVTKCVSPGWIVHRGHAIEEAGCQTPKTAVTQGSIVFLRYDVLNSEAQLRQAV